MVSGRMYRTHRLSWELANGPIPDGLWVLHTCDNPPCVNPAHLFLGTAADNNADMIAKGRHAQQIPAMRGEGNPSAKLRAADVRAIRARVALGASQAATARQFGVSRSLVNQVVRGHVWTTTAAA